MRIAVSGQHFEHTVAKFQYRNIVSTAAKVINSDFLVLRIFIESVCQSGCGRLVYNTLHFQTGYFTGFFGCLALSVVKVRRNGNNCAVDFFAKIIFCRLFHLLKYHGRKFLRRILAPVKLYARRVVRSLFYFVRHAFCFLFEMAVFLAHKTLDGVNSSFRVVHCLAFGGIAGFAFTVLVERYHRRRRAFAFGIGYDGRFVTFHHRYHGVGGTKVNANDFVAHRYF